MPRITLVALCATGLVGLACNARRTTERLALDTSLTPVPLAAASAVTAVPPPATGAAHPARSTLRRDADDAEVSPAAAKTFLLWARDAQGQLITYHLDRSGEELERLDGVYVGTRAGSWQWREEDVAVPTKACDHSEEDGTTPVATDAPPPGHATKVTLALTAPGSRVQRVVDPLARSSALETSSGDPESTTDISADPNAVSGDDHGRTDEEGDVLQNAEAVRHTVTLAGSIGPYLFIEESTYAFTCGAHGSTSVSARIWNVASDSIEPMPTDYGAIGRAMAKAAQELNEEDDPFPATDENLELTALVPHYGQRASLRLGLQLTAPTCYACTRGGYGSYTKSTVVDSATLPKVFARYAAAPGPVRAWVAAHPDEHLGGFSGLGW
jgi:hypothetical protein